jgi:hypothetical protein
LILQSHVPVDPNIFALLPASLTLLAVSVDDFDAAPYTKYLPRSLKTLRLNRLTSANDFDFPPSLESLNLFFNKSVGYDWLRCLPETLTELTFYDQRYALDWKALPRGLKKLRINGTALSRCLDSIEEDMPPNIEHMELSLQEDTFQIERLNRFPKSLRRGHLKDISWDNQHLPLLPHWMKELEMNQSNLSALSPTLTSLRLNSGVMSLADAQFLPSSLTYLNLETLNDAIASELQRLSNLADLYARNGNLTPEGCAHLPRSLRFLSVSSDIFSSPECLTKLPALSEMIFTPQGTLNPPIFSSNSSCLLPPTLMFLGLWSHSHLPSDWLNGLQQLQLLELRFSAWILIPETFLHHLPASLRLLSITLSSFSGVDTTFEKLPRGLQHLIIGLCSYTQETTLADSFAKALPRSLYRLVLPANTRITSACASDLPPYLNTFTIGGKSLDWFSPSLDPWKGERIPRGSGSEVFF